MIIIGDKRGTDARHRIITGTDPAANVEVQETVPANKAWHLKALKVVLVTDATAGTRVVKLTIDDGTTTFIEINTSLTQIANLTATHSWVEGLGLATGGTGTSAGSVATIGLPRELILPAGFRINTVTTNRQVGDNYGAPLLYVVEYDLA